jgi:5,10-methylene-tetrahydrofolate dehydrogenase/methenyl tetrahydrofolate cyclohydrolase
VVIDCAADVHADSVGQVAEALSPAKGGIGPLTVAWLLNNLMNAAEVTHV